MPAARGGATRLAKRAMKSVPASVETTRTRHTANRIVFLAIGCGYVWDGVLCKSVGQAVFDWCFSTLLLSFLIVDVLLGE